MRKIIERLLMFFLGIPAIIALVLFLPFYKNLAFNIAVIIFTGIGAVEFSAMLEKKSLSISRIEAFLIGSLLPIASTLNISFGVDERIIHVFLMAGAVWALMSGIFYRTDKMETVINHIAGCFSVMIYPGFFMFWAVKMSAWENPAAILLYLFIIFGNDSIAWLLGTLFGANNRGLIPASPNKSIAGFIGGLLGSVLVAGAAALVFPFIFKGTQPDRSLLPAALLTGLFTGIAATLGDLAESAVKRSCEFKDSGNLMLGRGGILDSIDSVSAAAPVFYLLFRYLFLTLQ